MCVCVCLHLCLCVYVCVSVIPSPKSCYYDCIVNKLIVIKRK